MLAQLSDRARQEGIRRFTALADASNVAVAVLLRNGGAYLVRRGRGTVEYEITLTSGAARGPEGSEPCVSRSTGQAASEAISAGRLARAGTGVRFIARGAHRQALTERRALTVRSVKGDFPVQVPATDDPAEVGPYDFVLLCAKTFDRAAVLADELGYEIFALPEGWGLDPAPVLTEIALRTARIRLASGVLSVWGRTPATLAMTAATLHQVCGGRYVLGLGASTKALVEGFHDTAFEHPAAKLRDVVTKVRALLAGQPTQLSHAPAARPLRLGQPPAPEVPIWVAALGHHTIRVAAELGDGWIPALVARDRLPGWAAQLREAAAPHARPLTVAAGPLTAVDENADTARGIAAGCTAWYLSAMGEVYARSVSGQGYAAQVRAIIAANPRPSPRRGTVPPAPRSCSTSSPPTEPAIRSASNSRREHSHQPLRVGRATSRRGDDTS